MGRQTVTKLVIYATISCVLVACGSSGSQDLTATARPSVYTDPNSNPNNLETEDTIWSIFNPEDTETKILVNKYLWAASIEVLNFLPVQNVDPFTGVIVTGFGTPPGGGQSYRATILIDDPALDARSLNVSLQTRSGPANPATARAVEDAILSRARQMRIADDRL
jgi:hypothetical protein